MPVLGPNYFSTVNASNTYWVSPQNAENAPDGLVASHSGSVGTVNDWLYCFDWQGSFPVNYFYDFSNFLIEIYARVASAETLAFKSQIILRGDGLPFGTISSDKNVSLTNTNNWLSVANTNWSFPYKLPTNTPIGIAIAIDQTFSFAIVIDSIRMTISYGTDDGFYAYGYGPGKKKRRFINKKGKVIAQTRVR